jgi:hypothetical protein
MGYILGFIALAIVVWAIRRDGINVRVEQPEVRAPSPPLPQIRPERVGY